MFSQYFGHYLLNNGKLTAEQLKQALELQKTTYVKFGVIAVDEGFLTSSQVEEIHEKQKQQDKRFGEIAVELGLLTEEQVSYMLSAQKKNYLILAQAIVDQGYMTMDAFTNALNEYKQLHSLSDEKFEAIKNGDIDTIIESLLEINHPDKDVYTQYLSLFVKNMIRFIDDQVFVQALPYAQRSETDWIVSQEVTGEKMLWTAIAADENVFLQLASIYAEETLTEVDELAKASVSEFLNLHNGIFLVNMSNKGIELNMKPQQVEKARTVSLPEDNSLCVSIHTSKGNFQLLVAYSPELVAAANEKRGNQVG
ncbi:hypothetical protein J2Z40_001593 [Cytobacillus eiseniae]|uniref:Chemotaxis protein CheX n=1 Tax=Cytobacillus eiseniae TaxID=762947 RepID=A0ABS4RF70_9BACI|nr:hypothetical protein [Cytobacillus eiseniae]MBP2241031.1 hypothetical protein [Cytobacillus eiseniae]